MFTNNPFVFEIGFVPTENYIWIFAICVSLHVYRHESMVKQRNRDFIEKRKRAIMQNAKHARKQNSRNSTFLAVEYFNKFDERGKDISVEKSFP